MKKQKQNWYQKLLTKFGYHKDSDVNLSPLTEFDLPASPSKKASDYLEALKGWVYGCVKARSDDVSQINLRLFRVKNRKGGDVEEIVDHDVLSLLHTVNPWQTFDNLIEATQTYLDLAGEAFWLLMKNKSGNKVLQIWALRPDWFEVMTDKKLFVKGYKYRVAGAEPITFEPDEIIHFKNFNPTNPYRGLSVVGAVALAVDSEQFAERYNRKFFENSAMPSIVLSTEQSLQPEQIKRIKAEWNNTYGGISKAHKTTVMSGGIEAKPFSVSQKDMEFLEGQKYSRDKILAIFKVPKTVLGMTEDVTVSNAEATDLIFAKRTVKPAMRKIVNHLNEFLIPKMGIKEDIFFTFDDPTPENREQVLKSYDTLFRLGSLTGNEIRDAEGLENIEGLDKFYVPINMMPVTGDKEDDKIPVKGKKSKLKVKIPPLQLRKKIARDIADEVTHKVIARIAKGYDKQKEDEIPPAKYTNEQKETYWKAFVQKTINFEALFKKSLIQLFNRQLKATLERLDNTKSVSKISQSDIDKVLFNLSTENKVAVELLVPILREYFEQQGQDSLDFVGSVEVFDMGDKAVKDYFKTRALKGVKKVNSVTKKALRSILVDAVDEGLGIEPTARNIKKLFGEAKKVRAVRIARTEILRAGNRASLEAFKQSRVVLAKEWFTALDERVCQWCNPMQGKRKALDNTFFNQGESLLGNKGGLLRLNFEEIGEPPLHPQCRCVLLPVTIGTNAILPIKDKGIDEEPIREAIKMKLEGEFDEKVDKEVDKKLVEIADEL